MTKVKKVKLSEHGDRLAPRVLGREIKSEILEEVDANSSVLFDLDGVESMSTGFAKELFGELRNDLSGDFPDRVRFEFGSSDENVLKRAIARGLKAASSKRELA